MSDIENMRDLTEAQEVARLAVHLLPYSHNGRAVYPGTDEAVTAQVDLARRIIAESRRQVIAASDKRRMG